MSYPGTSLTDNCGNLNIKIVDNSSYHVSWYVCDLPSYIVLQICQGLRIVVMDPFLEVPPRGSSHMGVGWPREVSATQNQSTTGKIPAKEFQRSVWRMGWCSILLVDNCVHIYSPLPSQCRNELLLHDCNVRVCVQCHLILILILKEVWPDDAISSNGTPCSHFLLAKRAMGMFMGLSLSPEVHILLVDVPTQVTVSLITKENKMQQTSVIFNSLTDIFTQFLVLLYCDQFASVISEFCKERAKVIMEDPQNWCSWNSSFLWETACGFSWGFLKAVLQILNILRNYGWPLVMMLTTLAFVGICHTSCLLKFGNQTFTCPSSCCIRKTDFVVDDFYSLLCIITSSWIHIGVKRISQACCLHHLKNMEKNCKTQLWDEKQNRSLFLDLPCKGIRCLNHWHMTSH